MKGLNREEGSLTERQAEAIERMIPRWEEAHVAVGLCPNFATDWEELSAHGASLLIGGMTKTMAELESRAPWRA